jgi:hypothetical protein
MSTDIQNQRLFDEGVHRQDYIMHRDWYDNCGECNGHFSLANN